MVEEARQREVRASAAPERLVKLRGGNKEMGSSRGEQVSASPITGASELMRRRQEASAASRVASPRAPKRSQGDGVRWYLLLPGEARARTGGVSERGREEAAASPRGGTPSCGVAAALRRRGPPRLDP